MTWAWTVRLPPTSKIVLLALADEANDSGFCFPSHQHVAKKSELGERTVRRMIKLLAAYNYLSVERRFNKNRSCASNGYRLAELGLQVAATRHADRLRCQPSFPQSRGESFFSLAYFAALSSTILRTIARSPAMNGVTCLNLVPSHRWNFTMPDPS
jgi:hypothetical protein